MYFIDILLFPVYKQYMYSRQYILCLHYTFIMKFMTKRTDSCLKGYQHKWVCLSVTEKNDRATYFPNAPRVCNIFKSLKGQGSGSRLSSPVKSQNFKLRELSRCCNFYFI